MTVDYAACRDALQRADAELDASECHGVLCGLLCAAERFPEERWFDEVLQSGPAPEPCRRLLRTTRRETERQLSGRDLDFSPMLPDDEEPLSHRGTALAQWCRGFLYGLGLGGLEESASTSEEMREVLSDLSEFTRLEVSESERETMSMEADYTELVEYVRVGVMLVHTEMRSRLEKPAGDRPLH